MLFPNNIYKIFINFHNYIVFYYNNKHYSCPFSRRVEMHVVALCCVRVCHIVWHLLLSTCAHNFHRNDNLQGEMPTASENIACQGRDINSSA